MNIKLNISLIVLVRRHFMLLLLLSCGLITWKKKYGKHFVYAIRWKFITGKCLTIFSICFGSRMPKCGKSSLDSQNIPSKCSAIIQFGIPFIGSNTNVRHQPVNNKKKTENVNKSCWISHSIRYYHQRVNVIFVVNITRVNIYSCCHHFV